MSPDESARAEHDHDSEDLDDGPRFSLPFRPTTGTKICLLLTLLLVLAAAFTYWTPLTAPTSNGSLFDCKSAYQPPRDDFSKAACGTVNDIYQFRAAMLLAAGLAVALVGAALFGFTRRVTADEDPV